jgi:hypothetical protein
MKNGETVFLQWFTPGNPWPDGAEDTKARSAHSGLVRIPDHDTSIAAAEKIAPVRSKLQAAVHEAFKCLGPMTAAECERLAAFDNCAPSTVRKRISELYKSGELVETGVRRGGMKEWKVRE